MSKLKPSTRLWALSIVLLTRLRLDRDVVLEAHPLHEARDAVRGEALHQVVLEGQVEARRARVALASGAAAKLVVDAPAVVSLGADDVQPAGPDDAARGPRRRWPSPAANAAVVRLALSTSAGLRPCLWRISEARPAGLPPSMMSVPRPAMFVAIVTAPVSAGLGDDAGLPLVELRVENVMLDAPPLRASRPAARTSRPRPCPTSTGRPVLVHLLDLVDERLELALLVAVHEVRHVLADHRPVGRDRDDLELVDLVELLGLGQGRAGHADELVVQPEVVLERDRGQGHATRAGRAGPPSPRSPGGGPRDQRRPGIWRPVNSSTMTISPSLTM